MAGNMAPLSHGVHTMNYVAHAQQAKDYMPMPRQVYFIIFTYMVYTQLVRSGLVIFYFFSISVHFEFSQRFNHPKYLSNEAVANGLAIHHGDSAPLMNNAEISDPQQMMLGNKLYPLVHRHQVLAPRVTNILSSVTRISFLA
jgi:polyadenylate-binding protein